MTAQDSLDHTLALLHEAALDDARWCDAARQLHETCRSRGSVLTLLDWHSPEDVEILFGRFWLDGTRREDWERRYVEHYFPSDPRVRRVRRLPPGHLSYTPDLYTDWEKKHSPPYTHALRATEAQNGLHVRLTGPHGTHVVWALADSLDEGWTSGQVRLIEHLLPQVREYVGVRQRLAAARALGNTLIGLLQNAHVGVIQLDRRGRIVAANDRALRYLKEDDGLGDDGGLLCSRLPKENAELSRLLAKALPSSGTPGQAGSMVVTRSLAPVPLALHVNPVRQQAAFSGRVAALVLIVDPGKRIPPRSAIR